MKITWCNIYCPKFGRKTPRLQRVALAYIIFGMQYYRKASHTVYDCTYHIVWITKYRYSVLVGDVGNRARDLIREICQDNGVEIIRGKVASNHIHIYVSIPPYHSVSKVVQCLKGKTSRKIQQEFPEAS